MTGNKFKILVIDDSQVILNILEMILGMQNWTVTTLNNIDDLSAQILKTEPDLILMDMLLSGANGCDACRQLKTDPIFQKIPIFIMSAHPEGKKEAFQAGADNFISKPFEMMELVNTVKITLASN